MTEKFVLDETGVPPQDQVEKMSVQDIWNRWVADGVDPDEEHVAIITLHPGGDEGDVVKLLEKGNLYECLVAASKADHSIKVKIMPSSHFLEFANELH